MKNIVNSSIDFQEIIPTQFEKKNIVKSLKKFKKLLLNSLREKKG